MIPKSTAPLAKFIRTGEGVLVYIFGLVLILVPIITDHLPPALSASLGVGKWLAIATIVSRSGLKAIASLTGHAVPVQAGADVQAVLADIAAAGALTRTATATAPGVITSTSTPGTVVEKPESAVKPDPPAEAPPAPPAADPPAPADPPPAA